MAVPNVRVDQLQGFIKQYEQSPSSFTLGLDAKTIWEGRGLGNLAKIGKWSLGGKPVEKPTRDFSVQLGSWQEVGDALGVEAADDRIEPVEAALAGLCSCVTEAITLNCARTGVNLEGLEVTAHLERWSSDRALEQVADPVLQDPIGRQPDCVANALGFDELVNLGIGEGRVAAKK